MKNNMNVVSSSDPGAQDETKKHPLEGMPSFESRVAAQQDEGAYEDPVDGNTNRKQSPKVIIDDDYLYKYENYHNGSHFMTLEENEEFERLWNVDQKAAVKYLREKWAEHADRDFIQSFRCIHWVSNSDMVKQIEEMLGNGKHEKEISTQAYDTSERLKTAKRWLRSKVGILVDGEVNLASNEDIQTNQWHGVIVEEDDNVKRRKYTENANRLMTSRDNCVSPYEFVVGDWTAKAIVADPDSITPELVKLGEKYNVPIIATDDESMFDKRSSEYNEEV
ncbi:MAG: hypothetical protein Q4A70_01185 [Candidatus Saccharibacteria bacterium]|nr:hypothetical protein [Candidatus Saccharibacteria bacterium]